MGCPPSIGGSAGMFQSLAKLAVDQGWRSNMTLLTKQKREFQTLSDTTERPGFEKQQNSPRKQTIF